MGSAHAVGLGTGSARPKPWHPDAAQDGLELRGVTPLPSGDHD